MLKSDHFHKKTHNKFLGNVNTCTAYFLRKNNRIQMIRPMEMFSTENQRMFVERNGNVCLNYIKSYSIGQKSVFLTCNSLRKDNCSLFKIFRFLF